MDIPAKLATWALGSAGGGDLGSRVAQALSARGNARSSSLAQNSQLK